MASMLKCKKCGEERIFVDDTMYELAIYPVSWGMEIKCEVCDEVIPVKYPKLTPEIQPKEPKPKTKVKTTKKKATKGD